jgi:5-formyltetrahydrofolate cyclo-ligase
MNDRSKDVWRKELRTRRKTLSGDDRARADGAITKAVLSDPDVVVAACVHVYLSTSVEVSTDEIIRVLIDRGVTVLVPWMLADGSMSTTLLSADDVGSIRRAGPGGVPSAPVFRAAELSAIDVVVVPVVGFDHRNHRIGMGAGHYDRFLATHRAATTIGLAYECQRVDSVPIDPHDVALSKIITGA